MQNQVSRPVHTKGRPERSPFWRFCVWPVFVPVPLSRGDRLVSGVRFGAAWALGRSSRGTGTDDGRRGPERGPLFAVPSRARFSQAGLPIWASRSTLRPPL